MEKESAGCRSMSRHVINWGLDEGGYGDEMVRGFGWLDCSQHGEQQTCLHIEGAQVLSLRPARLKFACMGTAMVLNVDRFPNDEECCSVDDFYGAVTVSPTTQ